MTESPDNLTPRSIDNGPLGYYWFLTFEHAPQLHALTKECQQAIDPAYFAATPANGLHLTLDRISRPYTTTAEVRTAIAVAARHACRNLSPFRLPITQLTNIRGAIGFAISPATSILELRDTLRRATLSVLPQAALKETSSDPHITIAYPIFEDLSDLAGTTAATAARAIHHAAEVEVTDAVLVSLELRAKTYTWTVVEQVALGARSMTEKQPGLFA